MASNLSSNPPVNLSSICLSEHRMKFSGDQVSIVFTSYIAPFLVLFGVTGNLINLTILMAPSMRTRSNVLLACLAVADMLSLLLIIPHSFANYRFAYLNYTFRILYVNTNPHFIALANWTSVAAIWFVLAICLERLIGIRYPLSVRYHRMYQTHLIVGTIVMGAFIITFYHHFAYACPLRIFCNETQPYAPCFPVLDEVWNFRLNNTTPTVQRTYVWWSSKINAIFGVFLPTVVVVLTNAMLIFTLRQRQKFLSVSIGYGNKSNGNGNSHSMNQSAAQLRLEQRVTLTVCAIVTCFVITQAPSAVVNLIGGFVQHRAPTWKLTMTHITTFMVMIGKSLNFVLFCLSSANFRHKLVTITKDRLGGRKYFRRCSQETEHTQMTAIQTAYSSRQSSDLKLQNVNNDRSRAFSLNSGVKYLPLDGHGGAPKPTQHRESSATLL